MFKILKEAKMYISRDIVLKAGFLTNQKMLLANKKKEKIELPKHLNLLLHWL